MFKQAALLLAAALAAGSVYAQEDQPVDETVAAGALRYEVVGGIDTARKTGAWPVREYEEEHPYTAAERAARKASKRRPRKEYPNVMGMSLSDWLDSRM